MENLRLNVKGGGLVVVPLHNFKGYQHNEMYGWHVTLKKGGFIPVENEPDYVMMGLSKVEHRAPELQDDK